MNKFKKVGSALVGFGAIVAGFSYFVILSIPLTALGFAFCILGCVVLIFPEYLVPHQVVKGMISGAVANIEAVLEEFSATYKAIYLPPDEGKVYAFCPLSGNPAHPAVEKIVRARKRIICEVDGHPGIFIYPPGADVMAVSGVIEEESEAEKLGEGKDVSLKTFLPGLENAIGYLLVDFAELASKVEVSFEENRVFLRAKNIKLHVDAPRFIKVLGSPPVSLACCCVAKLTKRWVKVVDEVEEGKWLRAHIEVGEGG
ncbi:hypothetical protein IBX65_09260 [Candidatus Aerophobetes bacterium]|nr:hypothetical protein [Candidatus Aerophobetes bacterium]